MPIPRKTALLCLLLAGAGTAQASQSLSLPQALDAAFAQNPELAAAGREIGIADGERRQAGLIPNPELSWEVEDTRRDTSTTTVTLSQPLELGGKRGARIAVAGAGQAIAQLDLERQRNGLRADVIQAFHAALRAQTALDLAQQSQGQQRGYQGYGKAPDEDWRKYIKSRRNRCVKISAADPCRDANTADVSKQRAQRGQNRGFARNEKRDQPVGGANRFHDCKIAPPVEQPAGERCQDTKRGG